MGKSKYFLGSYLVGLLFGAPEEILEHPGIALDGAARTGTLFLFSQECLERMLPSLRSIGEGIDIGNHSVASFFIVLVALFIILMSLEVKKKSAHCCELGQVAEITYGMYLIKSRRLQIGQA